MVARSADRFAQRLTHALESQATQEIIFNLMVKPVFEQSMSDFGTCMGVKVGGMLAELKQDFEYKLNELKHRVYIDTGETTTAHAAAPEEARNNDTDHCQATTADQREDASKGNVNTERRKQRRRRAKVKYVHSRSQLLCFRDASVDERLRGHVNFCHDECKAIDLNFDQRLRNLEVIVTCPPLAEVEWGPYQSNLSTWSALPADFLALQCASARSIQQGGRATSVTAVREPLIYQLRNGGDRLLIRAIVAMA
jgi:hypothetical protein